MTNPIGLTLLGQYRVDAFLAADGMGAVYRVWDLNRNVPLAMKVLHADLAEDPSIFKRFKREARALEKLAHPNIVPFYGLQQTLDFAFQLERYIDGPTLKDILRQRRGKPLPVEGALSSLRAVSSALGYAHMQLKPPDPHELNPDLPQAAAGVILKALEKEPEARFKSVRELYEAVCDAFGSEIENIQKWVSVLEALIPSASPKERMDIPPVIQPEKPAIEGVRRSALWLVVIPLVIGSIWILIRFTRRNPPTTTSVLNADPSLATDNLTSSPPSVITSELASVHLSRSAFEILL